MPSIDDVKNLHPAWTTKFNEGDVDGMLELADPRQIFVAAPGTVVQGTQAREALEAFLALKLPISTTVRHAYVMEDVALLIVDWSIRGTGPDGEPVSLSGTTADIARRGKSGWRIIIDNPYGTS